MKRNSLIASMALVIAAFAFVATVPAASALTTPANTTINSVVGHTLRVRLGRGAPYAVADCSSASATVVACGTDSPADLVQVWCLAPTALGGAAVTINYLPFGSEAPIPSTILTVNCAAASVRTIDVLTAKTSRVITGPENGTYVVASCTTDTVGASCTYSGESITESCTLAVTANVLPVTVAATVTVDGASPIEGQEITDYFTCAV